MEFYPTIKLYAGQSVTVVKQEDNNWLQIKPPNPGPDGSFSWVNASQVTLSGLSAIVNLPRASLRAGSRLLNQEPTVEQAKVTQGTQLTIIGKTEVGKDGTWIPVLPAPSEVRYIPADAIKAAVSAPQMPASPKAIAASPASAPAPTPTVSAPAGTNPLLIEAERAERDGNYGQAIRIYDQLANQVIRTDHELAMRCLNRSESLRNLQRGPSVTAQPVSRPGDMYQSNNAGRAPAAGYTYAPASYPCVAPPPSQYCYQIDSQHTARLAPPPGTTPPPAVAKTSQWYGPAKLRRTLFTGDDGKPVYAFEYDDGRFMYLTAGATVNLDSYLSRVVYVFGSAGYDGALRNTHMVVTQVTLAQ
jgi:hypothetical protein